MNAEEPAFSGLWSFLKARVVPELEFVLPSSISYVRDSIAR
jgi:hypothetical protein